MSSVKTWLLGGSAVAVLAALVLLALEVRSAAPPATVPVPREPAEAARAEPAPDRPRPALPPPPPPSIPRPPVRARPAPAASPPEDVGRRTFSPRFVQPTVAAESIGGAKGGAGELRERIAAAHELYDHADYEGARDAALAVLRDYPRQTRMLRIVVSSSCLMGEPDMAREYFDKLASRKDRVQMARRCARYGVDLQP